MIETTAIRYCGKPLSLNLMAMVWDCWLGNQINSPTPATIQLVKKLWQDERSIALVITTEEYNNIVMRYL